MVAGALGFIQDGRQFDDCWSTLVGVARGLEGSMRDSGS